MRRIMEPVYLRKGADGVKFYENKICEDSAELGYHTVGFRCMVEKTHCYGLTWTADSEEVAAKQGNDLYRKLVADGYERVTEKAYKELQPWD